MKFLYAVVIFYFAFCAFVYFYQKRMLYFPDKTAFKNCPSVKTAGGEARVLEASGARYYLIKTQAQKPKGWIIHFHGNGGRACDRHQFLKELSPRGYHLALAEYPGYAEDAPLPDQEQVLTHAMAVYEDIEKEVQNSLPVILFGESLGAAVATYVASKKTDVAALVLQTPFASTVKVGKAHYPFLPVKSLLRHTFPAGDWALEINAPVFVFHGTKDEIVPLSLGKEQFENFPSQEKKFWRVPKAGH
ncbi:MAG: alpha/beta hydrolase, partial [Bacteriovoracaceae bacterium]